MEIDIEVWLGVARKGTQGNSGWLLTFKSNVAALDSLFAKLLGNATVLAFLQLSQMIVQRCPETFEAGCENVEEEVVSPTNPDHKLSYSILIIKKYI